MDWLVNGGNNRKERLKNQLTGAVNGEIQSKSVEYGNKIISAIIFKMLQEAPEIPSLAF